MKGKYVIYGLIFVGLVIALSYAVKGRTIYVPDDYPTIQQAVNEARSGDVIIVNATYTGTNESIKIFEKSDLVIKANGRVIVSPPPDSDYLSEEGFYLKWAYNITIDGFIVQNAEYGILLHYSANILINNTLTSNNRFGIYLYKSFYNVLINNTATLNEVAGIYLLYSSSNLLMNNTAESNKNGFYLYYSLANIIANNTVNSNGWHGIWLDDYSDNNTITNNTVELNSVGIFLYRASGNIIANNRVNSNSAPGILVRRESTNNTLIGNVVNSNWIGIILDFHSKSNIITGNTANSNTWEGIDLDDCSENLITNNIANFNKGDGIELSLSSENILMNNVANCNNKRGILLYDSSKNVLTNNTANLNIEGIALIVESKNNLLLSNTVNSNKDIGILIGDNLFNYSDNNILISNTVNSNRIGIYLADTSSYNTLKSNTINSNYYGIFLNSSSKNILENNTVSLNNKSGIYLYNSQDNLIYNNYFNNTCNWYVSGDLSNKWNITKTPGVNIIGGPYLGGNYWSDYNGTDNDGDGLGDTELPYGPGDWHPLVTCSPTNYPPIANFVYEPTSPSTGETVYFTSTSYDPDGTIVNWTWDMGDGTVKYGEKITHSYSTAKTYTVNLTVKDNRGSKGYCEKRITISRAKQQNVQVIKSKFRSFNLKGRELLRIIRDRIMVISPINIVIKAKSSDRNIAEVEFYIDDDLKHIATDATYCYYWNE